MIKGFVRLPSKSLVKLNWFILNSFDRTSTCDHPFKAKFSILQCIVGSYLQVREGIRGCHLKEVILCEDVLDLAVRIDYRQTRNFERNKQINSLHHPSRLGDGLNI